MLVWSDNPNNRMMKLINGHVSEFRNPSNFCNGNTIDNEENLISCSHGGRCIYKIDDNQLFFPIFGKNNGSEISSDEKTTLADATSDTTQVAGTSDITDLTWTQTIQEIPEDEEGTDSDEK